MTRPPPPPLATVAPLFDIGGRFAGGEPYGNGHINDTFLVGYETPAGSRAYIFQRINDDVFHDPPALMANIERVTGHLRAKLEHMPGRDPDRETLTLVPGTDGKPFVIDQQNGYWRCYLFVSDSLSIDVVETAGQAREGGKAFGEFQSLLADLPGEPLHETIPRFHDMRHRLEQFETALGEDAFGRAREMDWAIAFVRERAAAMCRISDLLREGLLPERITHNDTKFNNVLLDRHGKALCVIDLDTVMTGTLLYDFGDAIRTATNTAREDERDLSRVTMRSDLFEAYARGYIEHTRGMLVPAEQELLAFAARVMTFIIGLRFLTDYLSGDTYFKIHSPDHNRVRVGVQFTLCRHMESHAAEMEDLVARLCAQPHGRPPENSGHKTAKGLP